MGGGRGLTGLGSAGVCRAALRVSHTGIGNSRGCPKPLHAEGWVMASGPLQVTASHKKMGHSSHVGGWAWAAGLSHAWGAWGTLRNSWALAGEGLGLTAPGAQESHRTTHSPSACGKSSEGEEFLKRSPASCTAFPTASRKPLAFPVSGCQ